MSALNSTAGLGTLWCRLMHGSTTWPIHGQYACQICGRRFPVVWAPADSPKAADLPPARGRFPCFALFVPFVAAAAVLARRVQAAEIPGGNSNEQAAATAFARYTALQETAGSWSPENIEISASLPLRWLVNPVRRAR